MSVLAQIISSDVPHLPGLALTQWWLPLGWAVVLAWGVAGAGRWLGFSRSAQRALALAMAVWTCIPGAYAPAYWLGLAFQAPSISLVALCGYSFFRRYLVEPVPLRKNPPQQSLLVLVGIVLGWVLLLDTFAVFPVALYAWGFSPAVPVMALLLLLLPWVLRKEGRAIVSEIPLVAMAVMAFVVLRLPTGNAWDALLDPWLWVALHVMAYRAWRLSRIRP